MILKFFQVINVLWKSRDFLGSQIGSKSIFFLTHIFMKKFSKRRFFTCVGRWDPVYNRNWNRRSYHWNASFSCTKSNSARKDFKNIWGCVFLFLTIFQYIFWNQWFKTSPDLSKTHKNIFSQLINTLRTIICWGLTTTTTCSGFITPIFWQFNISHYKFSKKIIHIYIHPYSLKIMI